MSQEFDAADRSSDLNDFESQLRGIQPIPVDNSEVVFYQAGWKAAELAAKDSQKETTLTSHFFRSSFTRGLLVGVAASLVVAFCLPDSLRFWTERDGARQSPESIAENNKDANSPKLPGQVDTNHDNNKVDDSLNDATKELPSFALATESISQLFPWNWTAVDLGSTKQYPNTSEMLILSKAFGHSGLRFLRTDSSPQTNQPSSEDVSTTPREPQLRASPLDLQRVLDYF